MRIKALAAALFLIICVAPGSKAGYFDGLPFSMPEMTIAFFVFLGIFATKWERNPFLKKSILFALSALLLIQLLSYKTLPYGWNVCIRSEASVSGLDSNCEPSLEFRSGEQTFVYGDIDFDRNTFPLYFLNNTSSFNFYLPEQPGRSSLPFTIEASTHVFPEEGDRLTIRSESDVTVKINDAEFTYSGSKKPEIVRLTPGIVNHVSLKYETDRSKKNILVAELPENHFFKIEGTMPGNFFVRVYQVLNAFLLLLLVSFFGYGILSVFRSLEKREKIILSFLGAASALFFALAWKDAIGFQFSAIPFAFILAASSFYYAISEKSIRRDILPFLLLSFFVSACALTTSHAMPEQAILFSGGNDELGHESFARHTMLATDFKEFASAAEPGRLYYYQPLYRYFLAALHSIFGEPMWGVYVAQTFLFSLAFLFSSVVLFGSIGVAALAGFTGLSILLLFLPQTSVLGIIQSPYQQAIGLSLLMAALVQISSFVKNPSQAWGTYFFWGTLIGMTFMMRTDWLVTSSGIALCILFILFSKLESVTKFKYLAAIMIGLSIFPILVGMRNHYIAEKFVIMPTSGFVNLINELAVPLRERIPLHENSASVFAKEILVLFDGRYSELLSILWNNVYKHIIDPTIVREALWIIAAISVAVSTIVFSAKNKKIIPHYASLACFSASFLSLIAVNSFFFQHNGMAMYGAYDFILLLILATSFQIISDRFGIIEYVRIKLNPYLQKIYAAIK